MTVIVTVTVTVTVTVSLGIDSNGADALRVSCRYICSFRMRCVNKYSVTVTVTLTVTVTVPAEEMFINDTVARSD